MLKVDPEERPTAEEALNHPWFSGKEVKENLKEATEEALRNFKHFRAEAKL